MLAIIQRELSTLFRSPLAWVVAAVLQVFFAWYFLSTLEEYMAIQHKLALQDHSPGVTGFMSFRYLAPCAGLLLIICPLIGMRSYSDEYRQGTFLLLQASPLSPLAIVLGKFFGTFTFIACLILLALIMPLSLALFTYVDIPTLLLSTFGLLAVAALCTAVSQFFSSLTRHPLVASLASLTVLIMLWSIGKAGFNNGGSTSDQFLQLLSTSGHLGALFQGLIDSTDIIYFIATTALMLGLTFIRVSGLGWSGTPGR